MTIIDLISKYLKMAFTKLQTTTSFIIWQLLTRSTMLTWSTQPRFVPNGITSRTVSPTERSGKRLSRKNFSSGPQCVDKLLLFRRYPVFGGMQDFNYLFSNAMELTIEVSCCKFPSRNRLLPEWENNINSILTYVEQANIGIKGRVVDEDGNPIPEAKISVRKVLRNQTMEDWRETFVTTSEEGLFWRLLLPGTYRVQAIVNDKLQSKVKRAVIEDNKVTLLNLVVRS